MALEGELGARQWVRQNLPSSHKEADEDHALDVELRRRAKKADGKRKADNEPEVITKRQAKATILPDKSAASSSKAPSRVAWDAAINTATASTPQNLTPTEDSSIIVTPTIPPTTIPESRTTSFSSSRALRLTASTSSLAPSIAARTTELRTAQSRASANNTTPPVPLTTPDALTALNVPTPGSRPITKTTTATASLAGPSTHNVTAAGPNPAPQAESSSRLDMWRLLAELANNTEARAIVEQIMRSADGSRRGSSKV